MPHPSLEALFIINAHSKEFPQRIHPNKPANHQNFHILDTDLFEGVVHTMIRTPDTNHYAAGASPSKVSYPDNAETARYFSSKQRRFEFQFQVRLKKVPAGRVYFACVLEEAIKVAARRLPEIQSIARCLALVEGDGIVIGHGRSTIVLSAITASMPPVWILRFMLSTIGTK